MSKINYRDKIILLSFFIIAILVCGFIFLIKPQRAEIKTNEATYKSQKKELDKLESQVDQIYDVQEKIITTHSTASQQAATFSPILNPDQLDEFVAANYFNIPGEDGITYKGIKIDTSATFSKPSTTSISYYYYTPSVVTYPLYTAADINGEFSTGNIAALQKSTAISAKTAQTVIAANVNVTYNGSKQEVLDFLTLMENASEKIIITSMDITSETTTYELSGNTAVPTNSAFTGSVTFQYYSAQLIDKLYKDSFKETSGGKKADLDALLEKYPQCFKEKEDK